MPPPWRCRKTESFRRAVSLPAGEQGRKSGKSDKSCRGIPDNGDISLKSGYGIDLIKHIKARRKNVRMLVWSMRGENVYVERALRAGAQGYITKEQATDRNVVGPANFRGRSVINDQDIRRTDAAPPSQWR